MRTQIASINGQVNGSAFGHAIVIGSSIAGLTAARVLTDHFAKVTIIDRDQLPDTADFRRGVPQARHAHTLPLRGQKILEQQFPGLVDELLAHGAISINASSELAVYLAGEWHELRHRSANMPSTSFSRPLLETTIYRRLAAHPRIEIIQEHDAVGLRVDKHRRRVTGLRLRSRRDSEVGETELDADLVVDASGRGSKAPQWLASLGYQPPLETTINAFAGYASRIYRQPAEYSGRWKTMYIKPTPPDGSRGGIITPMESDRWCVTLIGMAGDYPPTDENGFLAFARSLPTPHLYEAIKEAEPLTKPVGFRRTENRVRHYDRLPRYLEGFLVCGDAAYALNPVYAQGMTAAAMGSLALDRALQAQKEHQATKGIAGLAQVFQQELSQAVASPWKMGTREDQRWPTTEVKENISPVQRRDSVRKVKSAPTRTKTDRLATHVFPVFAAAG